MVGLEIQMGRRGVVLDREGEEGTELGRLYRGKGWEGKKGRGGSRGKEGRRKEMTGPPNKIPGSATAPNNP
jgi:hypothetical protein